MSKGWHHLSYAPVVQRQETSDLGSEQCGFKSLLEYANGPIVEKSKTSPCHGEDRGFESHWGRSEEMASPL